MLGKPEGKRPSGRSRHRWEYNNKKWTIRKWGREMDWIELAQDRERWLAIVHAVMNFRLSSYAGNFFIRGPVSFLGTTLLRGVSYSATLWGAHTV